jgi:two-component system CheB/CheR fusion protein
MTSESALRPFLIAIGSSAGGMAALFEFFDYTLPDQVSYVITTHLYPYQKSLLAGLLQKHSAVEVCEVENEMQVLPNIIYVMPENQIMTIRGGKLMLTPRDLSIGVNWAIDLFFESLARDRYFRKIAIILSGNGEDGTRGVRALSEKGAFVIAQQPGSADHRSMPDSVIASGYVNRVLLPADMPQVIVDHVMTHTAKGI